MANETRGVIGGVFPTFKAESALESHQLVTFGSTVDTVKPTSAVDDFVLGSVGTDVETGKLTEVTIPYPIAKAKIDSGSGGIAFGDPVGPTTEAGRIEKLTVPVSEVSIAGYAIQGGNAGDVIQFILVSGFRNGGTS